MTVVSAMGSNVKPMGMTTCEILIGKRKFRMDFIVCKKVGRPCYLGLDFLRKYKIGLGWSPTGKFQLQFKKETLVESIDTHIIGPKILTKADIQIQPRTLMVLDVQIDLAQATPGLIYDVMPNLLMKDEHPNLVTVPLLHNIESLEAHCVPYMVVNLSIKKLNYYLEDAEIIPMCDHLPLKKFLKRNTLNSKVNNWAVELSAHKIEFRYIKGIKNTLADTVSRLIQIDPGIELQEEEEGREYGYAVFESLPPIMTKEEINSLIQRTISYEEIQSLQDNDNRTKLGNTPPKNQEKVKNKLGTIPEQENRDNDPIFLPNEDIKIPIKDDKLIQMQRKDKFCKNLLNQLESGKLSQKNPYYIEEGILKRYIDDKKQRFEVIVLPRELIGVTLQLAHDRMGHNGVPQTYALLRRLYYWKGLKPMVKSHVIACKLCQMHNKQVIKYNKLNFETKPAPMKFISMDIIGEFNPPSEKGNKYALTVICMHTGFTFCIPIPDKLAVTVAKAYINNVYCWFGASHKILTDNGKEFKNALLNEVAKEIGVEHKIYVTVRLRMFTVFSKLMASDDVPVCSRQS